MKAVTHIHTLHSWDSRSPIEKVAEQLVRNGVKLALVSDHNSFEGSVELGRYAVAHGLDIHVPLAAEVRTDLGDVIVVLEDGEPPDMDLLLAWNSLRAMVQERQGVIWLPHPFRRHQLVEELASEADVIEVFNARCSVEENERATDLCKRYGAVPAFGADAHRVSEIGRFSVEYPPQETMLATLMTPPVCQHPRQSRRSDVAAAGIVNGFTYRRPKAVGYFAVKWLRARSSELIFPSQENA